MQECWGQLLDFIDEYPFSPNSENHFQLLLSSRMEKTLEFYILDSKNGLSKQTNMGEMSIVTLGSGKEIVDTPVNSDFLNRVEIIQEKLLEVGELPIERIRYVTLYLMCLWLSELSLTYESSVLNRYQVGGVFHFVCQYSNGEETQQPALYIFSSAHPPSKTIYGWMYRVAFVHSGLYVEIHKPYNPALNFPREKTEKYILFDNASSPEISKISHKELMQRVRNETAKLPFCFFCGFGFTPPQDRQSYGFVLPKDGKYEEIFQPDGQLKSEFQRLIQSNFIS